MEGGCGWDESYAGLHESYMVMHDDADGIQRNKTKEADVFEISVLQLLLGSLMC